MNASKSLFWSARWLGLGVKISCAHVHCFAPVTVTVWRWEMQSECRKTEVLVKIELLSSPRAVLCVCFAQHSKKKNQTSEASLQTYDSKLFSMNTLNTRRKSTLTCKLGSILPTGPQYELVADVWSMRMKVSTQHKQQQWLHLCQQKKTMAPYSAPRLN